MLFFLLAGNLIGAEEDGPYSLKQYFTTARADESEIISLFQNGLIVVSVLLVLSKPSAHCSN